MIRWCEKCISRRRLQGGQWLRNHVRISALKHLPQDGAPRGHFMLPKSDRREDSMLLPLAFLAFAAVVAFALPEGEVQAADNRRTSSKPASGGERGHGRQADSPTEIPARGWKDVLKRTGEQIGKDRLLAVAAGAVFYGLLAIFPAVTALVSSYALFADPQTINEHLSFIANVLPSGTFSIVRTRSAGCWRRAIPSLASPSPSVFSLRSGAPMVG
jgi:hypothetical protein